ncbi:uncharacterized protein LOC120357150 isoform X1 [Solenopsis invicta]|uniref:uncharacterized protein LOC120357150 isoform X1 n=1 Tax=Solenopsis invicta TaxID=13686 RepID=UPI00193CAC24|nr:uncharacterized protein LOC120357150 isoform X1 [Solenopsis invicta]
MEQFQLQAFDAETLCDVNSATAKSISQYITFISNKFENVYEFGSIQQIHNALLYFLKLVGNHSSNMYHLEKPLQQSTNENVEINIVATCGLCETICDMNEVGNHMCLQGFDKCHLDKNNYFYLICSK